MRRWCAVPVSGTSLSLSLLPGRHVLTFSPLSSVTLLTETFFSIYGYPTYRLISYLYTYFSLSSDTPVRRWCAVPVSGSSLFAAWTRHTCSGTLLTNTLLSSCYPVYKHNLLGYPAYKDFFLSSDTQLIKILLRLLIPSLQTHSSILTDILVTDILLCRLIPYL